MFIALVRSPHLLLHWLCSVLTSFLSPLPEFMFVLYCDHIWIKAIFFQIICSAVERKWFSAFIWIQITEHDLIMRWAIYCIHVYFISVVILCFWDSMSTWISHYLSCLLQIKLFTAVKMGLSLYIVSVDLLVKSVTSCGKRGSTLFYLLPQTQMKNPV